MIKKILKTTFLILFICGLSNMAKAQLGYDFSQYDLGFGAGYNKVYGDAETFKNTASVHFNLTYNLTPFTNFVLEAQLGKLQGGSEATKSGRTFSNSFSAYIFRAQLQMGEFLDYSNSGLKNGLKNFYVSAGLGYVVNRIKPINRNSIVLPGFTTPGEDNSQEPFLPLKIGYEFKLYNQYDQPSVKIDLGYQYNYIFGDDLDGFTAGNHNDSYVQFVLGVKFAIGSITSYRKKIQY